MVLMAATIGLRIGELGGLCVRHVDLDAKEIYALPNSAQRAADAMGCVLNH